MMTYNSHKNWTTPIQKQKTRDLTQKNLLFRNSVKKKAFNNSLDANLFEP